MTEHPKAFRILLFRLQKGFLGFRTQTEYSVNNFLIKLYQLTFVKIWLRSTLGIRLRIALLMCTNFAKDRFSITHTHCSVPFLKECTFTRFGSQSSVKLKSSSPPSEIWHLVSINNFSPGALLQTSTTQQSFACPVKSIIILASNGKNLSSLCINYAESSRNHDSAI